MPLPCNKHIFKQVLVGLCAVHRCARTSTFSFYLVWKPDSFVQLVT